jgi:hypothetical protein
MNRFRHPIRAIREPFGTAGLIVAVVALIAAISGVAYAAAGGSLTGKQKKEVEKIAKKFAGKPGAPGVNGTNGTNGAPGTAGPKGDNGTPGTKGPTGPTGVTGKSVQLGTATTGPTGECPAGGITVQVEGNAGSKKPVCNGLTGFAEVLPKGAQETGTWTAEVPASAGAIEVHVPISFPVPTAEGKEGSSKFFTAEQVTNEEFSNGCNWERSANAKPESTVPGTLCVFEDFGEGAEFQFFKAPGDEFAGGYARAGSYFVMERGAVSAQTFSTGAWAISGP